MVHFLVGSNFLADLATAILRLYPTTVHFGRHYEAHPIPSTLKNDFVQKDKQSGLEGRIPFGERIRRAFSREVDEQGKINLIRTDIAPPPPRRDGGGGHGGDGGGYRPRN